MSTKPTRKIEVTVAFAAAERPYRHNYAPQTSIQTVLADALTKFEITSDGTTRYYLLHHGDEPALTSTVAEVAGRADSLRLKLRTETIQG
ncbi:hypothetical protein [Streptosporangium sp. CA-115845]|uniref:hypothetical protein n=1 Tax=Streptosporangium sp. CA-115845 TaxID=3240071 RepID=UPI003D8F4F30